MVGCRIRNHEHSSICIKEKRENFVLLAGNNIYLLEISKRYAYFLGVRKGVCVCVCLCARTFNIVFSG